MKHTVLRPTAFATGILAWLCLNFAGTPMPAHGANLPPTLAPISSQFVSCGGALVLSNTASDVETPLNQLLFSLVNPLCATSSLPMAAYNIGPGLQAWRSHLADTNAINVLLVGESTTEGLFSSDINTTSYAAILRRRLQNVLGDGGLGLIPLYRELPPFTSYWDTQGNWTQAVNDKYGPFEFTYFAIGSQSYTEITIYGDNAEVFLVLGPAGTNGPTGPVWQVDNGPANNFNSFAPTFEQSTLNVPLGAPGWHTLRLTAPGEPGKSFGLWGASANLGHRGVRVHNAGKNGERVGKTATPKAVQFIDRLNPSLTVIAFSSNDYAMQTDTNDFRNSILALISEAKNYGSVLLLGSNPRMADMPTPIPQAVYHAILKDLAFSQNCAFIDMNERWGGSPAAERDLGFSFDLVHPTDLGYADMGNHLYCQMAGQPGAGPFFVSALEPDGLYIDGHTGVLRWTPGTNQCPSTNIVGVIVTDGGVPSLSSTQFFTVTIGPTNGVVSSNTAPVLQPLTNTFAFVGVPVQFTAIATDAEAPPQLLSFSLSNAPATAQIDSGSGNFTWNPGPAQVGTNTFAVVVADNGIPPLSVARPISIIVGTRPVIADIRITNTTATVTWSALPGASYSLLYKTNLTQAMWTPVAGSVTATATNASKADNFGSAPQRFYRVESH